MTLMVVGVTTCDGDGDNCGVDNGDGDDDVNNGDGDDQFEDDDAW